KKSGFKKVSYKKNDNGKKETFTIKKCGSSKIKANKTYYVKVSLYSKKNYKGTKNTKTYKVYSAPATTSKISVGSVTTTSAKISWKKIKGITKYKVNINGKTYTLKDTSKSISGLKADKKYTVKVRAYKQVKVNGKSVKLFGKWNSKTFTTSQKSTNISTSSSNSSSDTTSSSSSLSSETTTETTKTIVSTSVVSSGEWQNIQETEIITSEVLTNGCAMKLLYATEENCDNETNCIGYRIKGGDVYYYKFFSSEYSVENKSSYWGGDYIAGEIVIGSYKYTLILYDYSGAYRNVSQLVTYLDGSTETVSTTETYAEANPTADLYPTEDIYSDFHIDPYYADLFDQYYDNDGNYSNNKILVDNTNSWIIDNMWGDERTITGSITYDFEGYIK
ncbi:MAG: fibronectin type III domain-containing protein, partial [Lachnospiraceae bacterium]|nr:fibronectin type III domain-containing protein [Lachnospiraceae bacterium]